MAKPLKAKASKSAIKFHTDDAADRNAQQTRKRQKLERGFRRAVGKPVSDHESDTDDSDSDSSLTDLDSLSEPDGFRDSIQDGDSQEGSSGGDGEEDEDEDEEWENVLNISSETPAQPPRIKPSDALKSQSGDLVLTLDKDFVPPTDTKKKGASARERKERLWTHVVHVICLLYHGYLRNVWLNDDSLKSILLDKLEGTSIQKHVDAYLESTKRKLTKTATTPQKRKRGSKKGKQPMVETQETPDTESSISNRDLRLVELIGVIMRFWKKKFRITKPGLRKRGYREPGPDSFTPYKKLESEDICGLEDFCQRAKNFHGSRDLGAQLFTSLLRALGLEARLVFSLCPLGYGFSKVEMWGEETTGVGTDTTVKNTQSSAEEYSSIESIKPNGFTDDNTPKSTGSSPNSIPKARPYDKDLKFPTFWTEVYSPISHSWVAVDVFSTGLILSRAEDMSKFEPKGQPATKTKQQISYVIAYNSNHTARDVTIRYLTKKIYPGKTKGYRMPRFDQEILDDRGELIGHHEYDLFSGRILKCFQKQNNDLVTPRDIREEQELRPIYAVKQNKKVEEGFPTSVSAYKTHPNYVLERHLKREECIIPGSRPVHIFAFGKGEEPKSENVYSRLSIVSAKPAENWYKEGRIIKEDETPLKHVPSRAVTVNRKREIESAKRDGDTDAGLVGLYSFGQTELYRPPPIADGIIPKNSYGNIDCFVPSMVPEGASHVPYRNAVRICKKLGIEYAEAITGFEFKNKRAIPRAEGVLCAEEYAEILSLACQQDEEERKRKEDTKREQMCLALWRKFIIGLRIRKRVEEDYGEDNDISSAKEDLGGMVSMPEHETNDEPLEGGFIRDDDERLDSEDERAEVSKESTSPLEVHRGGFIPEGEEVMHSATSRVSPIVPNTLDEAGGFEVSNDTQVVDDEVAPPKRKGGRKAKGRSSKGKKSK